MCIPGGGDSIRLKRVAHHVKIYAKNEEATFELTNFLPHPVLSVANIVDVVAVMTVREHCGCHCKIVRVQDD